MALTLSETAVNWYVMPVMTSTTNNLEHRLTPKLEFPTKEINILEKHSTSQP